MVVITRAGVALLPTDGKVREATPGSKTIYPVVWNRNLSVAEAPRKKASS